MKNSPYMEYRYYGIEQIEYFSNTRFSITNNYFNGIEFSDNQTIKFYFRSDFQPVSNSISKYTKECQNIFLRLYLKMKKNGTFFTGTFYFPSEPIQYKGLSDSFYNLHEEANVLDKVAMFPSDSEGNPIQEEDFYQQQHQIACEKVQNLLDEHLKLLPEHENSLRVFMSIEHTVLKFMMMYSYLYELCGGNQEKTNKFIESTSMFCQLPINSKRKRIATKNKSKIEIEENTFTYYRNIVGHSYHEIMTFSEPNALCELEILNNYLLRILIEKMEVLV